MSREVRRVPLDFDWPLKEVWGGYLMPDDLALPSCTDCGGTGDSPEARHLGDQWYGHASFHPSERGSEPLTVTTPAVRAFAERNVSRSPGFYGAGEAAIVREAERLVGMWNGQWCHHLNQDDVDALVAAGRLRDFTHTWAPGEGWKPKDPPYVPTPAEVNEWEILTLGHDAINRHVVIRAELERLGLPVECATCHGSGEVGTDEQRAAHEAWQPTDPPAGDGWQLWETTSEGSPVSPVFADRAGLVDWLCTDYRQVGGAGPLTREQAEAFVDFGSSLGSGVITGDGRYFSGEAAVAELAGPQP